MSATLGNPDLIYVDGAMVPYASATIHVGSVAAKYGANVFEGVCAYARDTRADAPVSGDAGGAHRDTTAGARSCVFRVGDHLARLRDSLRLMQIDAPWSDEDYLTAILRSLRENHITGDAHLRLSVFIIGEGYSDGTGPASLVCIANARAPQTLDDRVCHAAISSWRRIDDTVMPPRVKAGANYLNSRYGLLEARRNGYDDAIFLNGTGKVAEASNSCIAMVRRGRLVTPPVTAALLESVTRASLLELASEELGLPVEERDIDRTELYVADEVFLCGSGQEVRPVLSIDRFAIGDGRIGPITRRLWQAYEGAVRGRALARAGWLTPVLPSR
jgi:branched-chain amino acid aminotransferase